MAGIGLEFDMEKKKKLILSIVQHGENKQNIQCWWCL